MMSLLTLQKAEKRPLNEQKQLIQQALSSITVSDESDDFMLTGDCAVALRRVYTNTFVCKLARLLAVIRPCFNRDINWLFVLVPSEHKLQVIVKEIDRHQERIEQLRPKCAVLHVAITERMHPVNNLLSFHIRDEGFFCYQPCIEITLLRFKLQHAFLRLGVENTGLDGAHDVCGCFLGFIQLGLQVVDLGIFLAELLGV